MRSTWLPRRRLPDELPGSNGRAYSTWISGFFLLVLVYYVGADLYLIDRRAALEPWQALVIGLGALAARLAGL